MKKISVIITAIVFLAPVLFAGTPLYVAHNKLNKLTVIDTAVNSVVEDIPLQVDVKDMMLDPSNKFLYFVSHDYNALYRLNTRAGRLDSKYTRVGYGPVSVAISPDGKKLYTANSKSMSISVVGLPSVEAKKTIDLPAAPKIIAITGDGRKGFVAMSGREGVAVIDLKSDRVIKTIPTGADPWGLCLVKDRLFMTNEGMASVSVIDATRGTISNEIVTSDSPRGLSYYNNLLYVAVMNGIDIFETRRYEKPASMGIDYPVYDCITGRGTRGNRIYIAGYSKSDEMGKVAVINPAVNEIDVEIDVDGWPVNLEMKRSWPTPKPTPTNTPEPTDTPTLVPTSTFTPVPTNTPVPTIVPTKKPTPKPTPKPKKKKKKSLLKSDLSGRVFMSKAPVAKVRIKAMSKHRNKIYTEYTDSNGRFTFEDLPIGGYAISVEATYIKEKAVAVTVNKGTNKELIIHVKKRK